MATGPETISVSQITTYLTCSLAYRFQYIDRLPRLHDPASMAFGSSMHATFQWLFKERKRGRDVPLDEVLRVFEADWYARCLAGNILFEDANEAEALRLKGREMLALYYPQSPTAIRESELSFDLPLINPATGEVLEKRMRGAIDLIEADGTIHEFKNSMKRIPADTLPDNLQLTAYSWAHEQLYGAKPMDLKLVNLVRTKRPDVEVQSAWRDERDYERLFHIAKEMIRAVNAGVFLPNRGCWRCKGCEYQADCFEWTGNEEVSA